MTTGSSMRYEARHFLCWATERRLVSKVEVPVRPKSADGYRAIEADERWSLLNRLWHDNTIPLDVRIGGSLVLLFGQPSAESFSSPPTALPTTIMRSR